MECAFGLLSSNHRLQVIKFQFVCCSNIKRIVLYVPWFHSDGPLKSKVSLFKYMRFFHFQALQTKSVSALVCNAIELIFYNQVI